MNWTDSDGRIYCFSSEDSKAAFLKDPAGNLQKAREFFASKQASAGKATKEFTEDDVNKRVQEVIAERSKDGAFVFHDPKLDADLNLLFEQIKTVRGMEGYGSPMSSSTTRMRPRSNTPSTSGSSRKAIS